MYSHTSKPIPPKLIASFEKAEEEKDADLEKMRLSNINRRNHLRKLEQTLRQKEKLADGLHLIDFEQLKIENQTLNEKIEERNEELLKLRKKTTTTVGPWSGERSLRRPLGRMALEADHATWVHGAASSRNPRLRAAGQPAPSHARNAA